jgi:large repetitive protein
MRFGKVVAVVLVLLAVAAPVALAFGFDDGVNPPRGILESPYSFAFKGRNGCPPYTFVFQNGALPPGLTMTPDGVIAGVPTAVGRYSFWVELRDSGCTGGSCPPVGTSCSFPSQRPFTIDIVAPLAVAVPAQIVAENGVALTATSVHGTGGRGPYIWQLVRAPDWLVIGQRGAIAGTPDRPGSFSLEIALTDNYDDRATGDASLIVKARLAITTTRLGSARVGHPFLAPLHVNGGMAPLRWKVTSGHFPVGVRLDTSTGVVTGSPTKAGTYVLRVAVRDAFGVASTKALVLDVVPRDGPSRQKLALNRPRF